VATVATLLVRDEDAASTIRRPRPSPAEPVPVAGA
jgi:hypothetical protein